jgi:hypothetical protein
MILTILAQNHLNLLMLVVASIIFILIFDKIRIPAAFYQEHYLLVDYYK